MKKIVDNVLLIQKSSDFTYTLFKYFYHRLGIFLSMDLNECPDIYFTRNKRILMKYYNVEGETYFGKAFYDEDTNTVLFDSSKYFIRGKYFDYTDIFNKLSIDKNEYSYLIPLSDIYHELIHAVQFQSGNYEFTPMVEASDEIFTYFITGQSNIEYLKEAMSLWYIARYVLNIQKDKLYVFIRETIVNKDFDKKYYYTNRNFLKLLAEKYDNSFTKFNNKFSSDFFYKKYQGKFQKDLQYIHDLIFYKY